MKNRLENHKMIVSISPLLSQARIILIALMVFCQLSATTAHADIFDWFRDEILGGDQQARTREQKRQQGRRQNQQPQWADEEEQDNGDQTGQENSSQREDRDALAKFYNQPARNLPILITKTEWTEQDETNFGQFVYYFGKGVKEGRCGTITACLQDPKVNIYAELDPPDMIWYVDCAKFPYFMRAYFAYHNGLPFGYANRVVINPRPYASINDRDNDLLSARLDDSPYGNLLQSRGGMNVASAPGKEPNFLVYLRRMINSVSSRTFRVGPLSANFDLSDVYPVQIDNKGVGPGTIITATGHIMMVWKVDKSGQVHIVDGHPGGFIQYHPLDSTKLQRSRPDQGLGFYRFRPIRLVGATASSEGVYYGGKIQTRSDAELYQQGLYSNDQWFGPGSNVAPASQVAPDAWKRAFRQPDFFSYMTAQLRDKSSRISAEEPVTLMFADLCSQIQGRMKTVNDGVSQGLGRMAHPDSLPNNIFGASDPTWEAYSTPGADARIKDTVRTSLRTAISQFKIAKSGSPNVLFAGSAQDYVNLLRSKFAEVAKSCSISYINSAGQQINLGLTQVLTRLNRLSFDPYMCPEKIWGASGTELRTCTDGDSDDRWYKAEQGIRNTVGKQSEADVLTVRSNQPITLQMLESGDYLDQPVSSPVALGTKKTPVMDIDAFLASPSFLKGLTE